MPILRPTDLYVVNGWSIEGIPGLVSPHFETLEGLSKSTQSVNIVDAGTNRRYKFPGQIMEFGDMSITRTLQGTTDDAVLENLVEVMMQTGLKLPACQAVKRHHGVIVFTVLFEGFRFTSKAHPAMDTGSEEKYRINYGATCDNWTII